MVVRLGGKIEGVAEEIKGEDDGSTDPDKEDGTKRPGNGLPNTATSQYNFLLIGVALILFGGVLTFYFRQRKKERIEI